MVRACSGCDGLASSTTENRSSLIDSVFVPLDGSEWHERAINQALLLCNWFGAKLDLFFSLADVPPLTRHGEWQQRAHLSVDPIGGSDASGGDPLILHGAIHEFGRILARDYLGEIARRLREVADVEIETALAAGSPAHILAYKALDAVNSVIVMYARPQQRIRRYLNKKMAEQLLAVTTSPVLMVNDDLTDDEPISAAEPPSVIVPLRVESAMRACLPYAIAVAAKTDCRITLLQSIVERKRNRVPFRDALTYTLQALEHGGVEYLVDVYDTGLTDALVREHQNSPSSWIAMGSRMRRGLTRHLFPSVVDNIRREVTCPILVVPQREILAKREEDLEQWLYEWSAHNDPIYYNGVNWGSRSGHHDPSTLFSLRSNRNTRKSKRRYE